jgi:hypothetical protein
MNQTTPKTRKPTHVLTSDLNTCANSCSYSPYASSPIAIDVGPGQATYYVSKHLLSSPHWTDTDTRGEISLPGVNADTGHTVVHYLYTGTYQTLEPKADTDTTQSQFAFKQALLTYMAAVTYSLRGLEELAKKQIEEHGAAMEMVAILETIRKDFSRLESRGWFHGYLQDKAQNEFDKDCTVFMSKAFDSSMGKGSLNRFMMGYAVKLLSKKLTRTLKEHKDICKESDHFGKPKEEQRACKQDTLSPEQSCSSQNMRESSTEDDLSFKFPIADCATEEYVDYVVPHEDSIIDVPHEDSIIGDCSLPDGFEDILPSGSEATRDLPLEDHGISVADAELESQTPPPEETAVDDSELAIVCEPACDAGEAYVPAQIWNWGFTSSSKLRREVLPVDLAPPGLESSLEPEPIYNEEIPEPAIDYDEPISVSEPESELEEPELVHDEPVELEVSPEIDRDYHILENAATDPPPIEVIPEVLASSAQVESSLCPWRSVHLLKGSKWKSCERCRAMLREVTIQLAKDQDEGEKLGETVEKLLLGE